MAVPIVPCDPAAHGDFLVQSETLRFNATTILNIIFLSPTALLVCWGNRPGAEPAHA